MIFFRLEFLQSQIRFVLFCPPISNPVFSVDIGMIVDIGSLPSNVFIGVLNDILSHSSTICFLLYLICTLGYRGLVN